MPTIKFPETVETLNVVRISKCQFPKCTRKATDLAVGRDNGYDNVSGYCYEHAKDVAFQNNPEYVSMCMNCGCKVGIN